MHSTDAVPRVFLGHAGEDVAFAHGLAEDLRRAGASVWLDASAIHHGDFLQNISDALAKCDWLVLVLTPAAVSSDYVRMEVFAALGLVAQQRMRGVIPVVAVPCDPDSIPPLWSNLHRYDATRDYDAAMRGLRAALDLARGTPDTGATLFDWREIQLRRLPVYLVLDCSGSMAGQKIAGVNHAIDVLYHTLRNDPRSVETVWLSIIYFGDTAAMLPLVPITQFIPPRLVSHGPTALGAALRLLNDSLDVDVLPNTLNFKGDYRPLVCLLSDGEPTDEWQLEAHRLKTRQASRPAHVIGVATSDSANIGVLREIATAILKLDAFDGTAVKAFFQWVSASIKTATASVPIGVIGNSEIAFPPLPRNLSIEL